MLSGDDGEPAPAAHGWRAHVPLLLILVFGTLTFSPSIGDFRFADDNLQAAMARGAFPVPRGAADLYAFIDDGSRAALRDIGFLPWWAHPQIQISFFRPLSSVLRYVEERWIRAPLVFHLHSMLWWAAAVLAAYALYARLFRRRTALVATLVFAVAPAHAVPLAWLANREALVSLAFGVAGLVAYRDFRARFALRPALLALALFSLAFLAGEYAVCLGGYVVALELFAGKTPRSGAAGIAQRVLGVLPFAVPAVAYLVVRAWLGYGSYGSGFYSDPLRDPAAFLHTAPWRLASLLGDAWIQWETVSWAPEVLRPAVLGVLCSVVLPVVWLVTRGLRTVEGAARRDAWWLLLGSLLALPPVLPAVPSTRLLGFAMLGVASTVALACDRTWWPPKIEARPRVAALASVCVLLFAFAHLVIAPVQSFMSTRYLRAWGTDFDVWSEAVAARLREDPNRDVVEVRGGGRNFWLPFSVCTGFARPHRWTVLSSTGHVLVIRPDATSLELHAAEDASLFIEAEGSLFRAEAARYHMGDEVDAPGMHVTVLGVGPYGPTDARFVFDRPLDDPRFLWLNDRGATLEPIAIPEVGMGLPLDP